MSQDQQLPLASPEIQTLATVPPSQPSSMQILETAIRGGITSENVAVVKELLAMRRDEMAFENKSSFNRAFFRLKQEVAKMDFYADKIATTKSGSTAYTYCSEVELTTKLESVLMKHGFAMMFGQRTDGERVIAEITLIHEDGHEEKREYAVRTGAVNAMKDATAVDTGSTTSAWRHLVIKLFGLKSRIREEGDAHLEGEKVSFEKVAYLKEQIAETASDETTLLRIAGVNKWDDICEASYTVVINMLEEKKRIRRK